MSLFPLWRKTVRRLLAGLIAAVGFYVGWWHFVRERRVEKLRWEQQWGREDLEDQHWIHGAGWGDDEPLPPDLEQWLEVWGEEV